MPGKRHRSRMKETICEMYASTAPNTAMFSSTAPTGLPCGVRWIASATAKPKAEPASSARCGVLRVPCVTDSQRGEVSRARERKGLPPV